MISTPPPRIRLLTGLSGRLLALTVCFVMLAEVLIYLPSVARYRRVYLEEQIAKAHLAALALQASPDNMITDPLTMDLLLHAGAHAIVLKTPGRRMLMLSDRVPPAVAQTVDIREQRFVDWIMEAIETLVQSDNRVLRVVGTSPRDPDVVVEVLLDERPLRSAMIAFSWRILTLSIIISLITAGLVYLVLQWWMVRPILRLTAAMTRFRIEPENEAATIVPSRRSDEIGVAERELAALQSEVRRSMRQTARLALLGGAVAKIQHDLRNTLASAMLASDRLAASADPDVQKIVPRLVQAIDRAVALSSRTLDFAAEDRPRLRRSEFLMRDLMDDVSQALGGFGGSGPAFAADGVAATVRMEGDREQLFRVFANLAINAAQAGASKIAMDSSVVDGQVVVDVRDDGPGIPAAVRARLFQPFSGTGRDGGSGLGLVIAREIVAAHGGSLDLLETGPHGTTFRVALPVRPRPRPERRTA